MNDYFKLLYKKTKEDFFVILKAYLKKETKKIIVTANPETFCMAQNDNAFEKILKDKNTIVVPDGIGIVKAAKIVKNPVAERIPGVDIAEKIMEYGNELNKKISFLGSTQEVVNNMVKVIKNKYPNLKIGVTINGYGTNKDQDMEKVIDSKADIILIALGMGTQEKLIYKYFDKANKGIFVGVGGSLDVLSGSKKRAPKLFIKLNLEWLYRLLKEPKRIARFYKYNIRFLFKLKITNKEVKK